MRLPQRAGERGGESWCCAFVYVRSCFETTTSWRLNQALSTLSDSLQFPAWTATGDTCFSSSIEGRPKNGQLLWQRRRRPRSRTRHIRGTVVDHGRHRPLILFRQGNSPSSRPVDRQAMAEAAERRMKEQEQRGVKGEVRLPKQPAADLPQGDGTLRWQVG